MNKRHRIIPRLLALLVCLALLFPLPVSAADLYFTSVNDNLLPLTADTMPLWSGGQLYVPYTVFDKDSTGVNLDLYGSYDRSNSTVTIYKLRKILVFDLRAGTCRDDTTGETFSSRAIIRNGRPYVPLNTVCDFFGLSRSYIAISQGYLVRIKSEAAVLSDAKFVDAASELINLRLREYNQSLNPAPVSPGSNAGASTGTDTDTPSVTPNDTADDPNSPDVGTYLAFLCRPGGDLTGILNALDTQGNYALFLMTPQALEENPDLVRRILGTGHSIGLLADGHDLEETRALLEQGNRILEQTAHTRTTVVWAPKDQRSALEAEGWVCWNESVSLSPSDTVGANAFASSALRRLEGRTRTTYLTLPGTANTGRVLSALLRQLKANNFVVSIPMETRL